ncbi:unnamed protein product, partial [Didymodactylos carnosus]
MQKASCQKKKCGRGQYGANMATDK